MSGCECGREGAGLKVGCWAMGLWVGAERDAVQLDSVSETVCPAVCTRDPYRRVRLCRHQGGPHGRGRVFFLVPRRDRL